MINKKEIQELSKRLHKDAKTYLVSYIDRKMMITMANALDYLLEVTKDEDDSRGGNTPPEQPIPSPRVRKRSK